MMKEIVKSMVFSLEVMIVAMGFSLWLLIPDQIDYIFADVVLSVDQIMYLIVIPGGILVWSAKESRTILFPPEDNIGLLQKWPGFYRLKTRVYVGLIMQLLFVIAIIIIWLFFSKDLTPKYLLAISTLILSSLFGAITFYSASIKISEILKTL